MVWSSTKEINNAPMRKSDLIQVEGIKRGKGSPKVMLVKVEKKMTCKFWR